MAVDYFATHKPHNDIFIIHPKTYFDAECQYTLKRLEYGIVGAIMTYSFSLLQDLIKCKTINHSQDTKHKQLPEIDRDRISHKHTYDFVCTLLWY